MVSPPSEVRHVVAWLPVARWTTCVALWTVLVAVWLLPHLDLPLRAVAPFGLAAAICRTVLEITRHVRQIAPRWLLGVSLASDVALLAGLLDITGGPFNPFIVMYVTYVWLAVVTLSPRWGLLISGVAILGFGWLVFDHLQAERTEHHRLNDFPTHLFTMWMAAAALSELVAHYVKRAQAALAERQRLLDDARDRAARSEHLASLTTLAAGAAHELSTPLATIAVASRELERNAARLSEPAAAVATLRDDARLIRTEVDRCQLILDGMSGRASHSTTIEPELLSLTVIAQRAQHQLSDAQRRRLRLDIAPEAPMPSAPGPEIVQTLSSLLKNAFDASDAEGEVGLRFTQQGPMLRIEVHDRGAGMSADMRRRAGEPFFTTKEPGRGLGLGLFLARTFAERSGGTLRFESEDGTIAILELPARVVEVSL